MQVPAKKVLDDESKQEMKEFFKSDIWENILLDILYEYKQTRNTLTNFEKEGNTRVDDYNRGKLAALQYVMDLANKY